MNDIPCRCGHLKNVHPNKQNGHSVCNGCFNIGPWRPWGDIEQNDCSAYVPDNLDLIEKLAKKRGLI
jgi:hypothetical protein